ncbi:BTAD domain-containing putative transcriptional regulator [Nocardia sp. NPDC052001]|uniref:BTAD domain-containing putative transcriptional regulator n=1 Tax=Nocardia sp. NPDC052001 TaxID=3154853 RepID=UPI003425BD56
MGQEGALQLTLLDGVEVRRHGQRQALGPPQRCAVLAVLAIRRRQWVSATSLLDALYDQTPPASGVGVVQTYISALRRILEPDRPPRTPPAVLLSGHGGYQLRIDDEQIDIGILDRLVAEASRARRVRDWDRSGQRYAEALALFSGDPMAGIPGPFAEQQRAAFSERRLAILEDSLEVEVLRGRVDQATDTLRMLVTEYPLREGLRVTLMRALAERGRRSEALEVYRETRRLLIDQLGVEPGPEMRRLQEQILDGTELVRTTPSVSTVKQTVRSGDSVLPGDDSALPLVFDRDPELARIAACARRAAEGVGGLVVIAGRPGYGKTQLLNEVARRYPHALRVDLVAENDDLPAELLRELGDRVDPEDSRGESDRALIDRLRTALARACADQPVLILIDDATRMNALGAQALVTIAPWLRGTRTLIVLTLDERPWDQHALDLHGRLEPLAAAVLRVGGLSVHAVAGLYQRRTGMPCPPDLAAQVQRASGEIPLMAGALIADLVHCRDKSRVPDRLPDGCYSRSIKRQLGRYSVTGANTLRALGALHEFDPTVDILAVACDEPVADMRHRCELLQAIGLFETADPPRFRHPLIANTIQWLNTREESAHFRTAAAAKARSAGHSARQVARYLRDLSGPHYACWTVVLIDAAEECLRDNAIPEAVRHMELTLRICAPDDRDDLLVRLGQLQLWTNPAAARAHLTEALHSQRSRAVAPTALIPLAWTMAMRYEARQAVALIDTVVAECESYDPAAARMMRASSWMVAALTAPTWRALVADLRAREHLDRVSAAILTWADAFGVRIDARMALQRLASAEANEPLPNQLLGLRAHLAMWAGDLTLAAHLTEQRGDQHFGTIDTYRVILRSEVLLRGGAYQRVLRELEPIIGDIDDELITPPITLVAQYAHALIGLDRLAEAERWLDRRTAGANTETWEWTVVIHIRGLLCSARGSTAEAIMFFLECGRRTTATGIVNPAHIPWRSSAALELVRLGHHDQARELAAAELASAQQWGSPVTIGRAMRAMALAAPGDAELLERAVALLRAAQSPVELIPALLDLAPMCAGHGELERARQLVREARALSESLGAPRYLSASDDLLRRYAPAPEPTSVGRRSVD